MAKIFSPLPFFVWRCFTLMAVMCVTLALADEKARCL